MTQLLVAALMWVLVASLLIIRRKRADRSVTYAALAIAIAMTLNVDAVYETVDPLLGGSNTATLIADTLLMVGLFFLGRGVMHAGEYRPRLVRAAVSLPTLLVALAAITVMFTFIERGHTTTQFMADLGNQPATATYSIINFVYCGIVIAAMLTLATRQYRNAHGVQRLPAALLTLGSAFGVALCVVASKAIHAARSSAGAASDSRSRPMRWPLSVGANGRPRIARRIIVPAAFGNSRSYLSVSILMYAQM